MGNRGCLHDEQGRLLHRRWARDAWVTCILDYKGIRRAIMAPGSYTELFFLDEATALAAGHRPCGTCRKDRYQEFKRRWLAVNGDNLVAGTSAMVAIDRFLHAERVMPNGTQRTWRSTLRGLPGGTMFAVGDSPEIWLVWLGKMLEWSPAGYVCHATLPPATEVDVLTPPSVVNVLANGYVPNVHPTARGGQEPLARSASPLQGATRVANPARLLPEAGEQGVGDREGEARYRLIETPRGKTLYTYFAAILLVTGMIDGQVFPLKKFLGNFSGHEKAGRIRKVSGGYQLTQRGIDYFNDRYSAGNPQKVERSEVEAIARSIRHGGGAGWEPLT